MNKRKLINTIAILSLSLILMALGLMIIYVKINLEGDSLTVKEFKEAVNEIISMSEGLLTEESFPDSLEKILWTNISGFSSLGIGVALLPIAVLGILELTGTMKTDAMGKKIMLVNVYSTIGLAFIIVIIGFVMKYSIESTVESEIAKAVEGLMS